MPQERPTNARNSLAGRWYASINNKGADAGMKKDTAPNKETKSRHDDNPIRVNQSSKNGNTLGDFAKHNHGIMNTFVRFGEMEIKSTQDILSANPSISSGDDMLRAQSKFSQESEDTGGLLEEARRLHSAHSTATTSSRQLPSSARIRRSTDRSPGRGKRGSSGRHERWKSQEPAQQEIQISSRKGESVGNDPIYLSTRSSKHSSDVDPVNNKATRNSITKTSRVRQPHADPQEIASRDFSDHRSDDLSSRDSASNEWFKDTKQPLPRESRAMPLDSRDEDATRLSLLDQREGRTSLSFSESSELDRSRNVQKHDESGKSSFQTLRKSFDESNFRTSQPYDRRWSSSSSRGTFHEQVHEKPPAQETIEDAIDYERSRFETNGTMESSADHSYGRDEVTIDHGTFQSNEIHRHIRPTISNPLATRIEYIDEGNPEKGAFHRFHHYGLSDIPDIALADAVSPRHGPSILNHDAFHHSTYQYPQNPPIEQQLAHPSLGQNFSDKGKEILAAIFPRVCTPIGLSNNNALIDEETTSKLSAWSYLDPNDDSSEGSPYDGQRGSERHISRTSTNPQTGLPRDDRYSHNFDPSQITNQRSGISSRDTVTFSMSSTEENGDSLPREVSQHNPGHVRRVRSRDSGQGTVKRGTTQKDRMSNRSGQFDAVAVNDSEWRSNQQPDPFRQPAGTDHQIGYSRHSTGGMNTRSRVEDSTLSAMNTDNPSNGMKNQPQVKHRAQSDGKSRRVDNYLTELQRFKSRHEERLKKDNEVSGGGRSRSRSNDQIRTRTNASDFFNDSFVNCVENQFATMMDTDCRDDDISFQFAPDFDMLDEMQSQFHRNDVTGPDGFPVMDFTSRSDNYIPALRSFDGRETQNNNYDTNHSFEDRRLERKQENIRDRSIRKVEKLQPIGRRTNHTRDRIRHQRHHEVQEKEQQHQRRHTQSTDPQKIVHSTDRPARPNTTAVGKGMVGKRLDRLFDGEVTTSKQAQSRDSGDRSQSRVAATSSSSNKASSAYSVLRQKPRGNDNEELEGNYMYVAYSRFGLDPLNVLQLCEHQSLPVPNTRKGEALIRVQACTVTSADCSIRRGEWPGILLDPFVIPGVAFVGRVQDPANLSHTVNNKNNNNDSNGKKGRDQPPFSFSTPIQSGDTVLSLVSSGANARYLCVPKNQLVKVPPKLDPDKTVCLVETYLTAFQALHRGQKGSLRYKETSLKGKSVLIMGGYTVLTKALIELCQAAGVEYCYGLTSHPEPRSQNQQQQQQQQSRNDKESSRRNGEAPKSSKRHFDALVRWGAIPLSKNPEDWLTLIGRQIDLLVTVYDPSEHSLNKEQVSGEHWKALRKDGQVVVICTHPGLNDQAQRDRAFMTRQTKKGGSSTCDDKHGNSGDRGPLRLAVCRPSKHERLSDRTVWYNLFDSWDTERGGKTVAKKDLEHLVQLLEQDRIHPDVMQRIPLSKVAKAQSLLERKQLTGHIVCAPWLKQQTMTTTMTNALSASSTGIDERE